MPAPNLKAVDFAPQPPEPRPEEEIMSGWIDCQGKPVVSILCIVYNHAPFLRQALNGFLMQETTFPFEIIVHDDASDDGSQKIIKEYQKRYPGIIKYIFQKENQYSKGKRALGLFQGVSDAAYLAVCEGDDYWLDSNKLQKQVEFLDNNEDYVITGHDAFVVNEEGCIIKKSKLPDFHKRDFIAEDLSRDKAWILTMSWVYRNIIKDFAPERNMVRNGDNFLVSLLGQYGKSHYHSDITPAVYRVHRGGVWSMASQNERLDDSLNTLFWMYRYYNRTGNLELAKYFHSMFVMKVMSRASFGQMLKETVRRVVAFSKTKFLIRKVIGDTGVEKVKRMMTRF